MISRGQALGYTISLPTGGQVPDHARGAVGHDGDDTWGRAAEEIVFSEVTTGASNDLEKVTATAKQMVMRFGMSDKLGPRVFGHDHGQPLFLGREFSLSPTTRRSRARSTTRSAASSRRRAPDGARGARRPPRAPPDDLGDPPQARDDEREQFIELLAGKSEEQVFGSVSRLCRRCRRPPPRR